MKNNETIDTAPLVRREGTMRRVKRVALATLSVAAFAFFTGGIVNSFRSASADTEVQISADFSNGSLLLEDGACAASPNQPSYNAANNMLNMSGLPGSIISNCMQVTAGTTSPSGYTLTIEGPATGNLTLGNVAINAKDGTMAAPTVFAAQTSGGVWGFAIPSGQVQGLTLGFDPAYTVLPEDNIVNTAKYAPVPTTATPFSSTALANVTADTYNVYFGAHLGTQAPTGVYSGMVTISIIGNVVLPPAPEITNIANSISTAYGTTSGPVTVTTDINASCKWNRNADFTFASAGTAFTTTGGTSHSTTVTGLASSANTIYVRCANAVEASMVSTASTTGVTISGTPPVGQTGDDMQNITASNCPTTRTRVRDARDGATYWIRKVGSLCWMETNLAYAGGGTNTYGDVTPAITNGGTDSANNTTTARYYVPTGSNRTTGTTDPSTATTGTGQYGYLYNWCASMNSQSEACQTAAASQPNQSVNGGTASTLYNIYPEGWRLPTGEATTGEFMALNTAVNSGATNTDTGLRTNSLFMYSGYWNNGSFSSQGTSGYYWSSTVNSATSARNLNFYSTYVSPANYSNKGLGFAVRCVAP